MVRRFLFLAILFSLAVAASAEVKLPAVLGNDMVLQRNSEVNLWGSATPDRTVTVRTSWNGKKYKTKSDKDGKWALKVATGEAGGPYEIEFSDGDKLKLSGILLGEVWVCGGQSNMEMPIKGFVAQPVQGAADAIRDSYAHPDIRIFNVGRARTETPQDDCKGEWKSPLRRMLPSVVQQPISSAAC
jgi:sialate O-acetylesterase